jgi:hypothetical protein
LQKVIVSDVVSGPVDLGKDLGCINKESSHGVNVPHKRRLVKSIKRSLAKEFECAAEEGCLSVTPVSKRVGKSAKKNNKE